MIGDIFEGNPRILSLIGALEDIFEGNQVSFVFNGGSRRHFRGKPEEFCL